MEREKDFSDLSLKKNRDEIKTNPFLGEKLNKSHEEKIGKREEENKEKTGKANDSRKPIIQIKNLRVIYNQGKPNEVRSLDDVSVEIYPQEYVVFLGPSGCGKSTLLYSIAGLQSPTYGDVIVEGLNISQMTGTEKVKLHRTGIGLIFQAFYLIPSLSVVENVGLPRTFMGIDKKKRKKDGLELLSRFGIVEQANKFPSQLSGGQKQRVAIARSLINDPSIILADEPVGNLDSESAENVLKILKDLNEVDKKTIILVTHNPEHLHFADRVIHIQDGKIIKEEVIKEKRPEKAIKKSIETKNSNIPDDLRALMRTFKDLSPRQLGILLVPFKARQLMKHILSDLTDEQFSVGENYLKDLLFRNISIETFTKNLDLSLDDGGAGWNKQRAESFTENISKILSKVEEMQSQPTKKDLIIANHIIDTFDLDITEKIKLRLQSFVKMRLDNKIDGIALRKRLDIPTDLGGIGLYKNTADKVMREIEIIMLLDYNGEK